MEIRYRSVSSNFDPIGPLEFAAIGATNALQDDGIALDMAGANLERFRDGGPLMRDHEQLVGQVTSVRATSTDLRFRARFPGPGISPLADETRGLLKDKFLNSTSLGFVVDEAEPLMSEGRRIGVRATRWRAIEISLVACPLDIGATVTARAQNRSGRVQSPLNEEKLHNARDAAERCLAIVADVLDSTMSNVDATRSHEAARSADYHRRQSDLRTIELRRVQNLGADFDRRRRQLELANLRFAGIMH